MSSLPTKENASSLLLILSGLLLFSSGCRPSPVAAEPNETPSSVDDSRGQMTDTLEHRVATDHIAGEEFQRENAALLTAPSTDALLGLAAKADAAAKPLGQRRESGEQRAIVGASAFLHPLDETDSGTSYGENTESLVPRPDPRHMMADRLQQAIQMGRMQDAVHQQALRDYENKRNDSPDAPQLTAPEPLPVTRFDLGLGLMLHPIQTTNISTTGRQTRFNLPPEEPETRARMLVGQSIGSPSGPNDDFLSLCAPNNIARRTNFEFPPYQPPGCNDGRDNNSNGFADVNDPACWADGQSRSTYSPFLSESEVVVPMQSSQPSLLPTTVAPPVATPSPVVAE